MNKTLYTFLFCILLVACGKEPIPIPPDKPGNNLYISLQYDNYVLFADDNDVEVAVVANTDYIVNVPTSAQSWVTFLGKSADGKFASLKISDNSTGAVRSAKISFVSTSDMVSDTITVTQNGKQISEYYTEWGILGDVIATKSNNRDYEWYFNQGETGNYSSVNCGPASTTMSIKWFNKNFDKSVSDARKFYRPTGGWWYTSDIISYLNDNGVNNSTIALSDMDLVKSQIDNGNIVIMCLDMNLVDRGSDYIQRVGKFYDTSPEWGHFIVIKGYVRTNERDYYQAYDPYSFNKRYADGTPVGRNRYYDGSQLYTSASSWWKYVIVISKSAASQTKAQSLNPYTIPHNKGK